MKKTKDLVKDALLCSLICVLLIIFNSFFVISGVIPALIIIILIGCFYQNKSINRCIIASLVTVLLCFMFLNPLNVLIYVFPSAILGIIASLLLKKIENIKIIFIVLFVLFLTINLIKDLAVAKFLLKIDYIEFITSDKLVDFKDKLTNKLSILVLAYILAQIIISILEVIILFKSNNIYKKRIAKFIGESYPKSE